jgi:hypothetical protein
VNKKNLAAKKKNPSESLENCTTFDAGILIRICHYCLKIKMKNERKEKKIKKIENPTTRKASSVTPILRPLGQESSLAPLRTTFDTWLPPDPLKPP